MTAGNNKHFSRDYSEHSDILNIHKIGKLTAGSAELGDFTVDFDNDGNVIGVEIMNASEFLSQLGIPQQALENMGDAEIIINKRGNYIIIMVKLMLPKNVEHIFTIPEQVVAEAVA